MSAMVHEALETVLKNKRVIAVRLLDARRVELTLVEQKTLLGEFDPATERLHLQEEGKTVTI